MTDRPYDGATPEQPRHPLVRELLSVHDMFRSQLAAMQEYIDELSVCEGQLAGPETTIRIQSLIRASTQYNQMLHMHHHLETAALFPTLRTQGLDAGVIDRLNTEHDEIAVLIEKFNDSIQHLASIEPDVMNHDLRRLSEALHAHLAYEETHVCPLLARFSR